MNTSNPNTAFLQTLAEYHRLGIAEQIDYKKFYLYSIITHSTALEGSSLTEEENYLLFEDTDAFVTSLDGENVTKEDTSKLTERQRILITLIKENPQVSIPEMSRKTAVTERTIKRDLQQLQQQGLVKRVGGRKEGHWEIIIPTSE